MQKLITEIIKKGLDEDLGLEGDITSSYIVNKNQNIKFHISNREPIILCGVDIASEIFMATSKRIKAEEIKIKTNFKDGNTVAKNSIIIEGSGNARAIFAAERLTLNLMQHLSGVSTLTNQYIKKLAYGSKTKILDTRKTIPTLRELQKYAVKIGGGQNHRMALYDGVLIKDNHIASAGSITKAVTMVRKNIGTTLPIEVECETLSQVKEALAAKTEIIMLDNMNLAQIKKAVKLINQRAKIEVSGGVNLKRVNAISKIGVDYISVGAITNSARAVDIGLDVV